MTLKTITQEELKVVLDLHKKYLNKDSSGIKADLSNTDLIHADLIHADLSHANLSHADLSYADLRHANLSHADLNDADLRGAKLNNADLSYAILRYADLRGANLRGADLKHADLTNADLRLADLRHADLSSAKNIPSYIESITNILPEGDIIGYKQAYIIGDYAPVIVKLLIKSDAKRSNATGRKCRCNECIVLDITDLNGNKINPNLIVVSTYDPSFIYKIGETIKVDNFDEDRWNECSTGIHFFITRQEAILY